MINEPDMTSKTREAEEKSSFLLEYNIKGSEFREGVISLIEWEIFKKEWKARFKDSMNEALKLRKYSPSVRSL